MSKAVRIRVTGRVQGVGFRPFVFSLAHRYNIKGTVQNNLDGVNIHAEGTDEELAAFIQAIGEEPPRLSRIHEITWEEAAFQGKTEFRISESERQGAWSLVIPVDSAVCDDCLQEMMTPTDLRYRYPFINCTQCGPRYTIIDELPYDRPLTSMGKFTMCKTCRAEYEDPHNRRHHAQPIACPDCGPQLQLLSMQGERLAGDPIRQTVHLLKQGAIVAIKGIGGYHLSCNAQDDEAIRRLRTRKNRPNRPLALMAADRGRVEAICLVNEAEKQQLESPERPIVILRRRAECPLPERIAPGMRTLGVMLPYTPLHYLLFDEELPYLVMTSANPSGQPILHEDGLALSYLQGIADYVLMHDREILHPLDDSVVRVGADLSFFMRRSRGYVPDPLAAGRNVHGVVALGGQQKNTFALGRHEQIFLGPHIGDMESVEVTAFHQKAFAHLQKWMGIEPQVIAIDRHPGFVTTQLAQEMKGRVVPVQHHHAHMVACMADNGLTQPCIGIVLDGTGYGDDGHIWGFEVLAGDAASYVRLAHLQATPLPGGEQAIKEPWRNAVGMLTALFGEKGVEWANQLFPKRQQEIPVLARMTATGMNAPLAGTCGRLFDAVSAILGICERSTYEGEAAIRLSEWMEGQEWHQEDGYRYRWSSDEACAESPLTLDVRAGLQQLVEDRLLQVPTAVIVRRFHQLVVSACVDAVLYAGRRNPDLPGQVVLSGGSFHNPFLSAHLARLLREAGYEVFSHKRVPCNDGGIALGQLLIAAHTC